LKKERNLQEELLRQRGTHEHTGNELKKENEHFRRVALQVTNELKETQIKYEKERKEWDAHLAHLDQTTSETTESLRGEKKQIEELLDQTSANYEKDKKEWKNQEKNYHERITEQKQQNDKAISELQSLRSVENAIRKKIK